jgi:hypothetical protein
MLSLFIIIMSSSHFFPFYVLLFIFPPPVRRAQVINYTGMTHPTTAPWNFSPRPYPPNIKTKSLHWFTSFSWQASQGRRPRKWEKSAGNLQNNTRWCWGLNQWIFFLCHLLSRQMQDIIIIRQDRTTSMMYSLSIEMRELYFNSVIDSTGNGDGRDGQK